MSTDRSWYHRQRFEHPSRFQPTLGGHRFAVWCFFQRSDDRLDPRCYRSRACDRSVYRSSFWRIDHHPDVPPHKPFRLEQVLQNQSESISVFLLSVCQLGSSSIVLLCRSLWCYCYLCWLLPRARRNSSAEESPSWGYRSQCHRWEMQLSESDLHYMIP